ncbi:hypothetical protein ACM782_13965 [Pseudomonas aeruginosa]
MSEVKRFDAPSMRSLIQGDQAVMGYEVVLASDYDALAAEAQALREQNTKFQHMLADITVKHFSDNIKRSTAQKSMDVYLSDGIRLLEEERDRIERNRDMWKGQCERQAEQLAALRARVVAVPDAANDRRKSAHYCRGWNACLDELARLNGLTVSEGLVQGMAKFAQEIICGALDGGSFDGADIQESAERHRLIAKQVMNEPCRGPEEYCACAWSTSFPAECYRVTPELRALLSEQAGGKP